MVAGAKLAASWRIEPLLDHETPWQKGPRAVSGRITVLLIHGLAGGGPSLALSQAGPRGGPDVQPVVAGARIPGASVVGITLILAMFTRSLSCWVSSGMGGHYLYRHLQLLTLLE